jgi:CHAD domain-containing protein
VKIDVREAAGQIWTERVTRWQLEFQRILEAATEDAVHDFRVASRRLRVALQLFSPVYRNAQCLKSLRGGLRNAARQLGPARDLTIQEALVNSLASELHVDDDLKMWLDAWSKKKAIALESIKTTMQVHRGLSERLNGFLQFPDFLSGNDLLEPYLKMYVRRHAEPLLNETRIESETGDVQKMHRLRILTKRFRYVMESTETYLAPKLQRLIKPVKKIQDILGHMHDRDVLVAEVQKELSRLTDSRRWAMTVRVPRNDEDAEAIVSEIRLLQNPDVTRGVLSVYEGTIRQRQELAKELVGNWNPIMEKISKTV